MGDYSWIGDLIGGIAKAGNSYGAGAAANADVQRAYDEMMQNMKARYADYDNLGNAGYQNITAQQTGPSAIEGIPQDLQARAQQQQAIAALKELADNGGLSLADMKAINDIQNNLNRNDSSRRQGLANEFAARGQLGSGAQLAMALKGQQDAAMNANQQGESVAAQAQARALQAILQKGQLSRQMGDDDYRRRLDSARAHDMIEARNAAARTDASKYNNTLAGQNFADNLSKLKGKTALTMGQNDIIFGRGTQSGRTAMAMGDTTNSLIDGGVAALHKYNDGNKKTGGTAETPPTSGTQPPGNGDTVDTGYLGDGAGPVQQSDSGDYPLPDEDDPGSA